MSTAIIIHPDFTSDNPPPVPPAFAAFTRQQEIESQNADVHAEARERYGSRLPIVIPFWYTMDDIVDRVHGFNRKPAFIATVGTRVSAFRKRVEQSELRLTA